MNHRKLFGIIALIAAVAVPAWALQEVSAEDYDAAMKSIGGTQRGVNDHLEAQSATDLGADGAKFVEGFVKAEAYWKARGVEEAAELAATALAAARTFQEAGAAGNFDAAAAAFGEMRQTCRSCHQTYRQRNEDGSFSIKQGS